MNETPETITAWANETFGPDVSPLRCAVRANLEMAELITAVTGNAPKELIAEECADVCIVLWRLTLLLEASINPAPAYGIPCEVLGVDPFLFASGKAFQANAALSQTFTYLSTERLNNARYCTSSVLDCLQFVAWALGFDLQAEINRKMQINRARQWTRDGTGIGYHVKTTA